MSLADRLRSVVGPGGSASPNPPYGRKPDPADPADVRKPGPASSPPADPAEILDGRWHDAGGQRYLVIDRTYAPGHRHGRVAVADSVSRPGGWSRVHLLATAAGALPAGDRLLFFDLETTGLAGGAGTRAFLAGCGWFEGGAFRIRQFLLTGHAAEPALLEGVADAARSAGAIVTYNGKTFDLPLIETRYLYHRLATPFAALPHIDMLHPARRLWRVDAGMEDTACRLTAIERAQLGHERHGDVPGFEIPARYFHYVRTGDSRPLGAVLEHNRQDLLTLAMLTARAARLLEEGAMAAATAREAIGLGRLYERGGLLADAGACFARGWEMHAAPAAARVEALRAYAVLCRRQRRHGDAADAWRRLLDFPACPPQVAREAAEALAVHHEHRARDLAAARRFAVRSLQLDATRTRAAALEYRLARLERKLGGMFA